MTQMSKRIAATALVAFGAVGSAQAADNLASVEYYPYVPCRVTGLYTKIVDKNTHECLIGNEWRAVARVGLLQTLDKRMFTEPAFQLPKESSGASGRIVRTSTPEEAGVRRCWGPHGLQCD